MINGLIKHKARNPLFAVTTLRIADVYSARASSLLSAAGRLDLRGLMSKDNILPSSSGRPSKQKREMELDKLTREFNITRLRKTPRSRFPEGETAPHRDRDRATATRPSTCCRRAVRGIDPIAVGTSSSSWPSDGSRHRRLITDTMFARTIAGRAAIT